MPHAMEDRLLLRFQATGDPQMSLKTLFHAQTPQCVSAEIFLNLLEYVKLVIEAFYVGNAPLTGNHPLYSHVRCAQTQQ